MQIGPGTQLLHYRIVEQLGEGGMGVVWRAIDTTLGRDVAIKVLPAEVATDPERLARFEREAKLLASLNHPHIAGIHGLFEHESTRFIAMELVEGEDLSARVEQGRIPLAEALEIARQLAAALESAHEHGIVHRDLKPANVRIGDDGNVKVLDFGLAKGVPSRGAADPSNSPTLTALGTSDGVILGTAAYMSPEQARGRPVDRRTDIWAFGVILFEMLSGRRLFAEETVSDTLAAVLTRVPDFSLVPATTRRLLRACLQPDAARRLRSLGDAWLLIDDAGAPTATRAATGQLAVWGGAAAVAGALLTAAILWSDAATNAPVPTTFVEHAPAGARLLAPPYPSPDGRALGLLTVDDSGARRLWIRELDQAEARPIEGTEGATMMFWSPDSRAVAFHADGELRRVDRQGGRPELIAALDVEIGVWTEEDSLILSVPGQGLVTLPTTGGTPRVLLSEEGVNYRDLDLITESAQLLIWQFGGETGVYLADLNGGNRRLLLPLDDSHAHFLPPDLLIYVDDRVLVGQRVDLTTASAIGDPLPLARNVNSREFHVSGNAISVLHPASGLDTLTWFDRDGNVTGQIGEAGTYSEVYVSPEGRYAMFVAADRVTGNLDLWAQETGTNAPRRLTNDPGIDHLATFSPDGRRFAWERHAGRELNIMVADSAGAGSPRLLRSWNRGGGTSDWSPDGRYLLYQSTDGASRDNLWLVPADSGDESPQPLVESDFDNVDGRYSPDGTWLAYVSDASGQPEIYLQRLDGTTLVGAPQRVTDRGGAQPQWRRDGAELFYIQADHLMVVPIDLNSDYPAGTPAPLFRVSWPRYRNSYAVSPDGQRILAVVHPTQATAESATVMLNANPRPEVR